MTIAKFDQRTAIQPCNSYESANLRLTMSSAGFEECLSIIKEFRNEEVLVKVNASMPRPPISACCTHPALVDVMISMLIDEGVKPIIVESSCLSSAKGTLLALQISEIAEVAKRHNIKICNLDEMSWENIVPTNLSALYNWLEGYRLIISIAKCKTHSMLAFSGCIKNLFGLIPGRIKSEIHRIYPLANDFSSFLLNHFLQMPRVLGVMDGIRAMVGDGPTHGQVFDLGYLGVSNEIPTLDFLFGYLLGYPLEGPSFFNVMTRQFPGLRENASRIINEEGLNQVNGLLPRSFDGDFQTPLSILKQRYEASKPTIAIDLSKCSSCFQCYTKCPVEAIEISRGVPIITSKCIRCLCCLEVCEANSINIVARGH